MKRLLLVEPHAIVRLGLRAVLEGDPELAVHIEAGSAEEALRLVDGPVDGVITEVSLPGMGGLALVKLLHGWCPELPILIVSMHDERVFAKRALRAGARGYVRKTAPSTTLLDAVQRVLSGHVFAEDAVVGPIVQARASSKVALLVPEQALSDRELEVFEKIGQGDSTGAIARKLGLSTKTIETHRDVIRRKLGLADGAMLARRAIEWVQRAGSLPGDGLVDTHGGAVAFRWRHLVVTHPHLRRPP